MKRTVEILHCEVVLQYRLSTCFKRVREVTNREILNLWAHQQRITISVRTLQRIGKKLCFFPKKQLQGLVGNHLFFWRTKCRDADCEGWKLSKELPSVWFTSAKKKKKKSCKVVTLFS